MNARVVPLIFCVVAVLLTTHASANEPDRPRAADLGIVVGRLPRGANNAITDVPGVKVGHTTIIEGDKIRTGVTAIVPHGGDVFRQKVPAAFDCFNGFGKPFGTVQVQELGELETPILLGNTLAVPRIADAVMEYVIRNDATGEIRSINPVVGETNDGFLNDIRARSVTTKHVLAAIEGARGGPVAEGSVGAGTGTRCFGLKGGIGTSSRVIKFDGRNLTVGVVVQSNYGGRLHILGREFDPAPPPTAPKDGSCAIVIATDAPLDARQLGRLARRTFAGMARTGASFSHGSGDYTFAFSTGWLAREEGAAVKALPDSELTPLFEAAADATEEAIYNSLLRATTITGRDGNRCESIDVEAVRRHVNAARKSAGRE